MIGHLLANVVSGTNDVIYTNPGDAFDPDTELLNITKTGECYGDYTYYIYTATVSVPNPEGVYFTACS